MVHWPKDDRIRAMGDGFNRPNEISFSTDQKTLYVGDTSALVGNGTIDTTRPSDVMGHGTGGPSRSNRRFLAMPDNQAADGIKRGTPVEDAAMESMIRVLGVPCWVRSCQKG
jgi:sugar lactone lactonase YvrE